MICTSSSNSWFISRNKSSIRITNKLCIQVERAIIPIVNSYIRNSSNSKSAIISNSLGSKMVSTSSSNSWFISRYKSSVRITDKLSVQVERPIVPITNRCIRSSIINSPLRSKMLSTCSSNSWFIKRNNSSVGGSNELSVQVKGASIAIGSSISWGISSISGSNNWGSCSIAIASTISSIAKTSIPIPSTIPSISQTCSKLGSKMVSTGSSNCWLINRSHSSIRVG